MVKQTRFNPEDLKEEKDFSAKGVSDWLKKAILTGTAAEPLISLLGQADKTRKDVMQMMARELKTFLDNIQVQDILRKVLSNATLEVEAKIRLVPDENKKLKSKTISRKKIKK